MCLPRFDSPACFAALLHDERAGVGVRGRRTGDPPRSRRRFLVLASEWESAEGAVRVLDFTPPRDGAADVIRIVEGSAAGSGLVCGGLDLSGGRVAPSMSTAGHGLRLHADAAAEYAVEEGR